MLERSVSPEEGIEIAWRRGLRGTGKGGRALGREPRKNRLALLMEKRRISLAHVAAFLNISESSAYKLIVGDRALQPHQHLLPLTVLFDVGINEILIPNRHSVAAMDFLIIHPDVDEVTKTRAREMKEKWAPLIVDQKMEEKVK